MPLNFNLDPKPEVSFLQQDELVVYPDTESQVELMVIPRAVGRGEVHLFCLADEVAFLIGEQAVSELVVDFHCESASEHQRMQVSFWLTCSQPSEQDILIRFDTWAFNAYRQKSPPILQLPVRLKPKPLREADTPPLPSGENEHLADQAGPGSSPESESDPSDDASNPTHS
jgi:hypothetical protein